MVGKILLIEDDPIQASMYSIIFSNLGHEMKLAMNGRQGLDLAKKEKPDLILLDLLLGDCNGFEILKIIKKDPDTKAIKVIILSNYVKEGLIKKCQQAGADDFLIKSKYVPKQIASITEKYLDK